MLDHYYCKYAIIMHYVMEIEQKAIQRLTDNHDIIKIWKFLKIRFGAKLNFQCNCKLFIRRQVKMTYLLINSHLLYST